MVGLWCTMVTAWVPLSWRVGALSVQAAQFSTEQCKDVQCKGVHLGESGGAFVGGVKRQAASSDFQCGF